MAEHEGHRERMKHRFLRHGLENFDDHNVLEILLFYAQPRRDTNETAHRLMETFGSLDAVFAATPEELMTVSGVKENAATLIRLVAECARRYLISQEEIGAVLDSVEAAGSYLVPRFMHCRNETVYLVLLDAKCKVLDCCCLGEGSLNKAQLDVRKILKLVLMKNASFAILSHNHTSGIAIPSLEDQEATRYLKEALEMAEVKLLDHIIVAGNDYVSLADDGMLRW